MATWHRRAAALFALVCAVACAWPTTAYSAPKAPAITRQSREAASKLSDVDSAEKYYVNMDYENANAIAARVVAQKGLTHDQLLRAYRILALTYATLGKEDQAREAFTALLTMDADFQLDPNLSPRIATPFMEARGFWRGQSVKPGLEVVATVRASESAKLVITTRDPTHIVTSVNVGYRWGGTGPFTTRPVAIGDAVSVIVPAAPSPAEARLDYYVEGLDDHDGAVFEFGSATAPKSAVVDVPVSRVAAAPVVVAERSTPGKSIFASPVFWTVAAVVVAGAVVGGIVLFSPKAPNGAMLMSGAECGAEPCR